MGAALFVDPDGCWGCWDCCDCGNGGNGGNDPHSERACYDWAGAIEGEYSDCTSAFWSSLLLEWAIERADDNEIF